MPRTPEQIAADEALTAAIEQVWRAYDDDPDPGLLLDYTVIAARRGINDDGETWSTLGAFNRDDGVPVYVELGLLQYRLTRLKQRLNEYQDEG